MVKNTKYLILSLFFSVAVISCTEESAAFDATTSAAVNGSYSQIIVVGDNLYGLNGDRLSTVDISDKDNVVVIDEQTLDFDIESIFHYDGLLFVGSSSAMYIYEIDSETGIPSRQSVTEYTSFFDGVVCFSDPIVTNETHAYVTLHTVELVSNDFCSRIQEVNELRIYDFQDRENPRLKNVIDMAQPKGLGIDGNLLFVCDGWNGLAVFDISDKEQPHRLSIFDGFESFDVIPRNGVLIVVAKDELRQYDYTDPQDIRLLSTIEL